MRRFSAITATVVALSASTVAADSATVAQAAPTSAACPTVVAHRTAPLDAPENTVPGIHAAVQAGADMVEMDVRWSSSDFPVLMHDPTVNRTTNGTGRPEQLGLLYMQGLLAQNYAPWKTDPAHADTRVPYGWDFMNAVSKANVDALLDIQVTPSRLGAEKLVHYIDLFGWRDRTLIMGSPATVAALRGWYPEMRYAVIEYPPAGRIMTGDYLKSLGAEAYVIPWDRVTPAIVGYFHAEGAKVYTWTTDRAEWDVAANWQALTAAGVDAIITDRAAGLRAAQTSGC